MQQMIRSDQVMATAMLGHVKLFKRQLDVVHGETGTANR